jgi:LmbE family N-acetylglucosaminyl deacetylase
MIAGLVTLIALLLMSPDSGASRVVPRYGAIAQAERNDRVLIVAPHIDDEVIGAGGYALDAIRNGADVYVVFLTAGDCNRLSARMVMHKTYLEVGKARIAESRHAMALLGVPESHVFVLGYPDRGLKSMLDRPDSVIRSKGTKKDAVPYSDAMTPGAPYSFAGLSADLRRVLDIARPTTVIAPVPFDHHPDHAAAALITDAVLADTDLHPQRFGYLVHTSRIPKAWLWLPKRALQPPPRFRQHSWMEYPLSPEVRRTKNGVLLSYKSQGPYVFLLRDAYVRKNELFVVYENGEPAPPPVHPKNRDGR